MTKDLTDPTPITERVTSRSTIGAVSQIALGIVHTFGGGIDEFEGEKSLVFYGLAVAFFAIGYLRDVAMAWIQAKFSITDAQMARAAEIANKLYTEHTQPDAPPAQSVRSAASTLSYHVPMNPAPANDFSQEPPAGAATPPAPVIDDRQGP